jgi:hypothetical protein
MARRATSSLGGKQMIAIAESINDTDLPCLRFRFGRMKNVLENRSPFYDIVEKVNQKTNECRTRKQL